MQLNEISFEESRPIDGYGPGFFRIGGEVFQGGAFVLPNGAGTWNGYEDVGVILAAAATLDVLFVGTGAEIAHLPDDFRKTFEDAGIGVEVMNSPSACRTFNILLSEGRRIGAALLPV
jgi:uncharacterized protein